VLGRRSPRRPNTLTLDQKTKGNIKSIVGLNYANTERHDLYRIKSLNTSFGFDAAVKNWLVGWKLINVEYSVLDTLIKLKQIFNDHPDLRNLFNAGLVVSTILSGTTNLFLGQKDIFTIKLNTEWSYLPYFNHFMRDNYFRFLKLDGDFKWSHKNANNVFVARFFAGAGFTDPVNVPGDPVPRSNWLPFFKAYYAGGPNSMRGWGLRRLGPGHTTAGYDTLPDRFGDFQLEANIEKRFYLFRFFGLNVNSALFTDIGNVWFLRPNNAYPGGDFKFSNLLNDLAVDMGVGLRADLGFFLIRLDYAYKVRNPSPEQYNIDAQYKWFYDLKLFNGTMQFGVTYPF
jgi:outer membrane protein insertion porin family